MRSPGGRRERGPWWITGVTLGCVVAVLAAVGGVWLWSRSWSHTYTGTSGGLFYTVVMPGELHRVGTVPDGSVPSQVGLQFRLDGQDDGGGSIAIGSVADELATLPLADVVKQADEAFSVYGRELEGSFGTGNGMVGRLPAEVLDIARTIQGVTAYTRYYIFEVKKRSPVMFVACSWNRMYTAAVEDLCRRVAESFVVNLSPPQ